MAGIFFWALYLSKNLPSLTSFNEGRFCHYWYFISEESEAKETKRETFQVHMGSKWLSQDRIFFSASSWRKPVNISCHTRRWWTPVAFLAWEAPYLPFLPCGFFFKSLVVRLHSARCQAVPSEVVLSFSCKFDVVVGGFGYHVYWHRLLVQNFGAF